MNLDLEPKELFDISLSHLHFHLLQPNYLKLLSFVSPGIRANIFKYHLQNDDHLQNLLLRVQTLYFSYSVIDLCRSLSSQHVGWSW